jgi:hypothetical protein
MADDKANAGWHDRDRINLDQDYEVRDWRQSLSVTEEEVRAAVQAVGITASNVRERLQQGKR